MKFLLILSMLMVSGLAEAGMSIQCVTSPGSTSFLFNADDNKASLTVIHHNGVEHAPLINGIATGYSLDILKDRLDYVTKMGESFSVDFDLETCRFDAQDDMACYHKSSAQIGDLQVEDYYFSIFKEVSQSKFGEFLSYRLGFEYRINGLAHQMTMTYYGNDCRFSQE